MVLGRLVGGLDAFGAGWLPRGRLLRALAAKAAPARDGAAHANSNFVSEASYQVEPPDILMIEMLKLVPLPPYRIDIYDVLQIRVIGTLLDQPIDGFFLVEGEGIVTLGPAYGRVRVAGMTIEEAAAAITRKLSAVLSKPEVSVQLARTAGTRRSRGEYLVGPDGTINLRQYGSVHVAGKTVHRDSPRRCRSISVNFSIRPTRRSRCGRSTARCFT